MKNPIENYRRIRLNHLKEKLEENNFEVHVADSLESVPRIVQEEILAKLEVKTLSWGGSTSFVQSGLYEQLKDDSRYEVLDTYDKSLSPEEVLERRRQSLLVDLFITGANAVTEDGMLVNLDMIGNRVGAIAFGPKQVILIIGRNKIVPDLEAAFLRVKDYAAPVNTMRLDKKTPCVKTGRCEDCKSPDRICNHWTITEKSFPKGRIKIVLVDEDLGF
jgi:L-lactate utilization protein LutC